MWEKIVFKNYFLAALGVNIVLAVGIILIRNFLPPVLPLFYGRPSGAGQLTAALGLTIAPIASLIITLVNSLLAYSINDSYLKKVFAISSLVIAILTAITVTKIVFLIGLF